MLRGIYKQMIVYKPPVGSRFECAYFVLRNEPVARGDKETLMHDVRAMLAEGERRKRKERTEAGALRRALWIFLGGMACGAFPFCMLLIFT